MAKKKPQVPAELTAFIKQKHTTFHFDDGDWDLLIASREDSDFKDNMPPRAIMIAENGSGDCLFLKTSPAGKIDARVFVYWHEEDRDEVFAKSLQDLIATSNMNKKAAAKAPKSAKAPANKMSVKEVEALLKKKKGHERWAVMREFHKSDYGLEALPMLRRVLAEDDASMVIHAAECIAKLGPEAATCPAGEAEVRVAVAPDDEEDLCTQLTMRGGQTWSYSGYANAYSSCLDALVKLEYEPDGLIDYIQVHIGLSSMDLIHSLEALRSIGTPEARDLAKRALAFWLPELNMSEAKKAKALVESIGAKKKK